MSQKRDCCLQPFFAERFFALFDTDGGGTIDLEEMMAGLNKITRGTNTEKLKFLFDVYDVDGKMFQIRYINLVLISLCSENQNGMSS